jgi:spore coat polysaccharide biosynthesis protein SpsF
MTLRNGDMKDNVVVIIQARMGSSRFPGKMMADLGGVPLIEWVIRRSKQSGYKTILATTNKNIDDELVIQAEKLNTDVFRGDENDVLARYHDSATEYHADTIVRVCADRPLISAELIQQAVSQYRKSKVDIFFNHISDEDQTWPRGFGVEVFSYDFLKRLNKNVKSDFEREHVTLHAWNNRSKHKILADTCLGEYSKHEKDLKLDVDTHEDLERLRNFAYLYDISSTGEHILKSYAKHTAYLKLTVEDYDRCRKEFVDSLSSIKKIKCIYETGTVSAVGLSDLDFLIIVDDNWKIEDTKTYTSKRGNQSEMLQQLIGGGTVLIVPDSLKSDIKLIDDFRLKSIYGEDDWDLKDYNDNEYEVMRILDWLPERVSKICHEVSNNINIISIHGLLKSLNVSFFKLNKLLENNNYSKQYRELNDKLQLLRAVNPSNMPKSYKEDLYSLITEFVNHGVYSMLMTAEYLRESDLLYPTRKFSGGNQFKCFNLKSKLTFNAFEKNLEIDIPDVFFLNYYVQSIQNTELSVLIKNGLIVENSLFDTGYYISDKLKEAVRKRNEFVNLNLDFLKNNNFKSGLLKYGMFL